MLLGQVSNAKSSSNTKTTLKPTIRKSALFDGRERKRDRNKFVHRSKIGGRVREKRQTITKLHIEKRRNNNNNMGVAPMIDE